MKIYLDNGHGDKTDGTVTIHTFEVEAAKNDQSIMGCNWEFDGDFAYVVCSDGVDLISTLERRGYEVMDTGDYYSWSDQEEFLANIDDETRAAAGIPPKNKKESLRSVDKLIEQVVLGKDPKKLIEDEPYKGKWGMEREWALQFTDTFDNEEDAVQALEGLKIQDGYLGGRVMPPTPSKPGWRLQAFFQDEPEAAANSAGLPDGMRRVLLLPGQKHQLGIRESLAEGKVLDVLADLYDELSEDPATWGTATKSGLKAMGLAHLSQMGNWQLTKAGKAAQQIGEDGFMKAVEAAINIFDHRVDMLELSASILDNLSTLGWIKRDQNGNRVLSSTGKAVVKSF